MAVSVRPQIVSIAPVGARNADTSPPTIAAPSSLAIGDLHVIVVVFGQLTASGTTVVTPVGMTTVQPPTAEAQRQMVVHYRPIRTQADRNAAALTALRAIGTPDTRVVAHSLAVTGVNLDTPVFAVGAWRVTSTGALTNNYFAATTDGTDVELFFTYSNNAAGTEHPDHVSPWGVEVVQATALSGSTATESDTVLSVMKGGVNTTFSIATANSGSFGIAFAPAPVIDRAPVVYLNVNGAVRKGRIRFTQKAGVRRRVARILTPQGTGTPPPEPTPTPNPTATVASILNIGSAAGKNHYSVQVGYPGATGFTHTMAELEAGYKRDPELLPSADGTRVDIHTQVDAKIMPGSSWPRVEFRGVDRDGGVQAYDARVGEHWQHQRGKLIHLPPNKSEIVLSQLHNGASDRIALRIQKTNLPAPRLIWRVNGVQVYVFKDPLNEGDTWRAAWRVGGPGVADGVVRLYDGDMTKPVYTSSTSTLVKTSGVTTWYDKVGNYLQTTDGTDVENPVYYDVSTEYGKVQLWDVRHGHSYWGETNALGYPFS